jgi:hypothetical protein
VSAWEKKNAKTALRAGGVSTLALSLAACGGSSDSVATPTTPVVIDTDGDGVSDALDAFPSDATETKDTDGDGIGDNADAFPTDATNTPALNKITLDGTEAVVAGTAGADEISAVVSALSSADTLSEISVITGGEGADVLKIIMGTDFAGFTDGKGSMKGVETVELKNTSSTSREFDASGISGVEVYKIDGTNGAVTLKDVADLANLEISSLASGTVSVAFSAATVAGTADEWTVEANGVGTANSAAATLAANTKYVSLSGNGIETLNLESNAAPTPGGSSGMVTAGNYFDLSGLASVKEYYVLGSQDIFIKGVGSSTKFFDGSLATGDIVADLSGAATGALEVVKTGSGDDSISVVLEDMPLNGTIALGEGDDTLNLTATTTTTVQPKMTGVETLEMAGVAGTVTLSLTDSDAPAIINVSDTENTDNNMTGTVKLVNDSGTKDINIHGSHGTGKIETDTTGAIDLDFTVTSAASKTSTQTAQTSLTAAKTSNLDINIADYSVASGTFTAAKATTVNVTSGSTAQTALDLITAKVIDLNVTTSGDLTLGTNAKIGTAETITVVAGGAVNLDSGADEHAKAAKVDLSGAGSKAAVDLGAIGSSTLAYGVDVKASGLKAGLDIGAIDAGTESVSIDLTGMTGASALGAIDAGKSVTINANGAAQAVTTGVITAKDVTINAANAIKGLTVGNGTTNGADIKATGNIVINGSQLNANGLDIDTEDTATATTVAIAGGIGVDAYTITTGTKAASLTVTGDLGLGADTLAINLDNTSSATGQKIDVSGVNFETIDITIAKSDHTGDVVDLVGSKSSDVVETFKLDGTTTAVVLDKLSLTDINAIAVTGTGTDVTINASAVSGQAIAVKGSAATQNLKLTGTSNADTIDLSKLTDGADLTTAIYGNDGDDTITGSLMADTITGGAGADTLTGGAGKDTFVFSGVTTALNGADIITDFSVADGDILDVGALSNTITGTAIDLATAAALAKEGTSIAVADTKTYVAKVANKADIDTAAEVKTALIDDGVLDAVDFADSKTGYLVLSGADDTTALYVYGVTMDSTAGMGAGDSVDLLATITTDSTTLLAAEIA